MFAQETEELAEVARIGVERVAGDAALTGEFRQPFPRHRGEFGLAPPRRGRGCLGRGLRHVRSCPAAAERRLVGRSSARTDLAGRLGECLGHFPADLVI